jgi:hypothetical protein
MFEFLTRLLRPQPKKLTEIDLVRAALVRHRKRIDDMDEAWREAQAPCCPGCMFGPQYTEATRKVERVEAWLAILESRKRPSP